MASSTPQRTPVESPHPRRASSSSSRERHQWPFLRQRRIPWRFPPRKSRQNPAKQSHTDSPPVVGCAGTFLDLPVVVWMSHVFLFLERHDQDSLAQAHAVVARARRQSPWKEQQHWPCGRIDPPLSRPVKGVVFSPDDSTLWVVYCKSKVARLDKITGSSEPMRPGHSGVVTDVRFSPDGSILATAGRKDGSIRMFRKRQNCDSDDDYKCFRILDVHMGDLKHIVWSPKGDKIASWGLDGFVRVSNTNDGSMESCFWKTRLEIPDCHRSVAFCPNGREIALARNNDRVVLWDLGNNNAAGEQQQSLLPDLVDDTHGSYAGNYITSLAYSPDGSTLVVGCHVAKIKVWWLVRGDSSEAEANVDHVYSHQIHLGSGWSAVTLLTFTADGLYLACCNGGSQIRVVNVAKRQVVSTLVGHSGRIESLCFTSDGATLASGSCDRTVRLWSASGRWKKKSSDQEL